MSSTTSDPGPVNGQVSHWFDGLPPARPPLPGSRDADVCIVGAGYTGLWTAYYLKRADPSLRIVVLEARCAGFGASGRNGGWLSGLVPGDRHRMAQQYGRDGVLAWQRALNEAVDEVIDVAARESIDAGIVKGGTLEVARNPAQARRLAAAMEAERQWEVDGIESLTKADAAQRIQLDGVIAAYHNPHCARIQPALLARGLADTVERLGVDIYERSPVTEIAAGRATTPSGTVSAPVVLRATEGFTARLPGLKRRWLPMNSSMIATDPIPASLWDTIGWQGRETLGDTAHGFFYAQRTVDDRIAIGLGWAGGYVGHGVTATNLAARTLTDLVLKRDSPLTALPWVGHRSANWEPEPLRWLGVRGMYLAYKAADWHESRGTRGTSPIAVVADKIAGRPH